MNQVGAVAAVAAWDLPSAPSIELPDDTDSFATQLRQRRLIGPLLAAAALGDVELPDELAARLIADQEAALLWCIELENRLIEVHDWLDGVDYRVIKGPAIAHLDAIEPSIRTFADIDLLIPAEHMDEVVAVLAAHGATRPWEQRRPGWDRRFAKSVTMTFPEGMEFDLHRMIADGVHGHRIPVDRLFVDPQPFEVGGVTFLALSPTARLLHSAYHLLLGSPEPGLASLRDLAGYLATQPVDVVVDEARLWRGEVVLAMAIDLVDAHLGVLPEVWRQWRVGQPAQPGQPGQPVGALDSTEVELVERHRGEGSSLGRAKLDVLRELPTLRLRAAYLGALVWPSLEHLRSRGQTRRDALGRLGGLGR